MKYEGSALILAGGMFLALWSNMGNLDPAGESQSLIEYTDWKQNSTNIELDIQIKLEDLQSGIVEVRNHHIYPKSCEFFCDSDEKVIVRVFL